MNLPPRSQKLVAVIFILLVLVLACNMPGQEVTEAEPAVVAAPELLPEVPPDAEAEPEVVVEPPEGQPPADEPPPEIPAAELGFSRANPYPMDVEVMTLNWDFQVLEYHRGAAAWDIIQADDPNSTPPPPGQEYVLLMIFMRCKEGGEYGGEMYLENIFVTGDLLQAHQDFLIHKPAPELVFTELQTGDIFTAWLDALVNVGESNLMLVFDKTESVTDGEDVRTVRYVALDPGAAITIPADLDAIPPNELGLEPESPAQIGETLIGDDWEFTALEAVTGQAALDIVMQMNDKSDPPEAGMEYLALRARMRRISTADRLESRSQVWAYAKNEDGYWETVHSRPRINNNRRDLFPAMEYYFFPGLTSEGWFILLAPVDQTPHIMRVVVGEDFSTGDRYIQLTP